MPAGRGQAEAMVESSPDDADTLPVPTVEERLFAMEMRVGMLEQRMEEWCQLIKRGRGDPATGMVPPQPSISRMTKEDAHGST